VSEKEDLERELQSVVQELRRREAALAGIDQVITGIRFSLDQFDPGRAVRTGHARAVMQADARRRQLREELEKRLKERGEAAREVARAEERKSLLEEELVAHAGE
jgi:hypothetical protein